jgi:hypothetical protein
LLLYTDPILHERANTRRTSAPFVVPQPENGVTVAIARPLDERHSATSCGFTHRSAFISSASIPSPQWPVLVLGRFANGQRFGERREPGGDLGPQMRREPAPDFAGAQ